MLRSVESFELGDPELRISQLRGLALESSSLVSDHGRFVIDDLSEGGNHLLLTLHELVAVVLSSILFEGFSWSRHHRLVLFGLSFCVRLFGHLEAAC